jgi:hypothetical protein
LLLVSGGKDRENLAIRQFVALVDGRNEKAVKNGKVGGGNYKVILRCSYIVCIGEVK